MSSNFTIDTKVMRKIAQQTPDRIGQFLDAVAISIKDDVRQSFPRMSPSPAGGPPGIVSTALLESINWEPEGKFRRVIHDGVLYGIVHEVGMGNHPARPFMTPVFKAWEQEFGPFAVNFGLIQP